MMGGQPPHEALAQQQLRLLSGALRERMQLLEGAADLDPCGVGPRGGFVHRELTRAERAAKGLTEIPSALELQTARLLEGEDAEEAARDAGAAELRRWLEMAEGRPELLGYDDSGGPPELLSPARAAVAVDAEPTGSPPFEQPGSPAIGELGASDAGSSEVDQSFSEMHAAVAAVVARHAGHAGHGDSGGAEHGDGAAVAGAAAPGAQCVAAARAGADPAAWSAGAVDSPPRRRFAEPPDWRHVDPHPHLSLGLGLESISPETDWREFLAPTEGPSEEQLLEAMRRVAPPPLPFVDEPNYEDEWVERIASGGGSGGGHIDPTTAVADQRVVLVPSGVSAQLCTECYDCPCSCSGVELGGGLRAPSLCLVCCNLRGCSCGA